MLSTSFTELVGCETPIHQAPMGGISPPQLARAVAAAGGVGTISVPPGGQPPADLDRWVSGPGVFAVNFVGVDVEVGAVARAARSARIVDFFWSDPRRSVIDAAHGEGAVVNWQVGSRDEALLAVELGADVVTVQGHEAGGHVRGRTPLRPLLASVLAEVSIPVLAAGGISDAGALAEVLAAGAAGARLGTRFIASDESGAHPDYEAAILRAGSGSTTITDGFAICPLCATQPTARVLASALRAVAAVEGEVVGTLTTDDTEIPLPPRHGMPPSRAVRGQVSAMALYAGEAVGVVTRTLPAGEIVRELTRDAEDLLRPSTTPVRY
jgi:NAD(P)H-dependent flavin oxidoreductase YrpB (nitropropane dioxygenase family)